MTADDYIRAVARALVAKHVHGRGSSEVLAAWDAVMDAWRALPDGQRGKARRGSADIGYGEAAELAWARRVLDGKA